MKPLEIRAPCSCEPKGFREKLRPASFLMLWFSHCYDSDDETIRHALETFLLEGAIAIR
jgi:hypothetical protein